MRFYTKEECGEKLNGEQYKHCLFEMLCILDDYCTENGIRYYLSGGTLLGAIRHHGFIPWDDDIDINMPRPDLDKLLEISGGRIGRLKLETPSCAKNNHVHFYRLYDESIIIEDFFDNTSKKSVLIPAFMDIFPIEGLPDSVEESHKLYDRMTPMKKLLNCTKGSLFHGKTVYSRIFHAAGRPLVAVIGKKRIFDKIQEISRTYDFDSAKYIGVTTTTEHTYCERVVKDEYLPQIDVEFEGRMFKAPAGYDTYLRQLYGDRYMELPPVEKRQSHGFSVFRLKQTAA